MLTNKAISIFRWMRRYEVLWLNFIVLRNKEHKPSPHFPVLKAKASGKVTFKRFLTSKVSWTNYEPYPKVLWVYSKLAKLCWDLVCADAVVAQRNTAKIEPANIHFMWIFRCSFKWHKAPSGTEPRRFENNTRSAMSATSATGPLQNVKNIKFHQQQNAR